MTTNDIPPDAREINVAWPAAVPLPAKTPSAPP